MEPLPKFVSKNIRHLSIRNVKGKNFLEGIRTLTNVHTLDMVDCKELEDLSGLHNIADNLQTLEIMACSKVANIEEVAMCSKLQSLKMYICSDVTDIAPLANCTLLSDLHLNV